MDINWLKYAISRDMHQWNHDSNLGFLWKKERFWEQRAWWHQSFLYTIFCSLDSVLIFKNHTSGVSKGVCTNLSYFLDQMSNFGNSVIIAGPHHGTKQETGAHYTIKSWSEELHRELSLFIGHKIHITSTRESYFLWHSNIRQPKNHAVVCHLGRAPR